MIASSVSALLGLVCGLMVLGCTHSNEVKDVETKLDVKGNVDGKQIGLNDEDEVIIQEKTEADDELRALQWANVRLQEQLDTDHHELKRCREDLADHRLGGSGTVRDLPDVDNMKPLSEIKEEFGRDEDDKLKVVKRENYGARVTIEKKFQDTLKSMQKIISKHRIECERDMRQARVKAGLPSQRFKAEGRFLGDGTWVETRPAELTLDDAFAIKGRAAARKSSDAEDPSE